MDTPTKHSVSSYLGYLPYLGISIVVAIGLFQFSTPGKVIYAVYAALASVLVILPLLWLFRNRRTKWPFVLPVALLVLIAPPAEEFWISHRFETLCEDAGVHVYKTVAAEGYYDDTTTGWSKTAEVTSPKLLDRLNKTGFSFSERKTFVREFGKPEKKMVSHFQRRPDGTWHVTILEQPQARYHYKKPLEDDPIGWRVTISEYVVVDSRTSEILGDRRLYKRYPGAIEISWIGWFGTGMQMCPDPGAGPRQPSFPSAVFVRGKAANNAKDE
jgi:hypothetical protein